MQKTKLKKLLKIHRHYYTKVGCFTSYFVTVKKHVIKSISIMSCLLGFYKILGKNFKN